MKYYPFFPPQDNMSIWAWLLVINQEESHCKSEIRKERGRAREAWLERERESDLREGKAAERDMERTGWKERMKIDKMLIQAWQWDVWFRPLQFAQVGSKEIQHELA